MEKKSSRSVFFLIMITALSLYGCGGSSSRPANDNIGNNNSTGMITISGKAFDDPIVNGDVVIYNLSNTEIATAITDEHGEYTVNIDKDKLDDGYIIIVSGGLLRGNSFEGELKATYSSNENLSEANVTLITTLIDHIYESSVGETIIQKRNSAIENLSNIGLILPDEWSKLEPSSVNLDELRSVIHEIGLNLWITQMISDLSDNELSSQMMTCFPKTHGGIKYTSIGSDNIIKGFKGRTLQENLNVFTVIQNSNIEYEYQLFSAPDGMTISDNGIINYFIPDTSATETLDFQIEVSNNGKGRTVNVQLQIMDTEVVASGDVGPDGGRISDEWEEIILTIPEGAVSRLSSFKVLKAIDENGKYSFSVTSSDELSKLLELRIPEKKITQVNDQTILIADKKKTKGRFEEDGWVEWKTWFANFIEIKRLTDTNAENRMRNDSLSYPVHDFIELHQSKDSSKLFSLCGTESDYINDNAQKDPVLFVHGYNIGSADEDNGHGGGKSTWGKLPELLSSEGYAVFEFTWRTNARFKDAAADLADAIAKIQNVSGKKINIIAHSFGGLLARTYLQNYANNKPYLDNVQSLVTLGTPHSGIFDVDGTYHNIYFPKGQDSLKFEGALQISVHQAGESVERAYTIPHFGNDLDISSYFGINKNPGELVAQLSDFSAGHKIPVSTLVLIGLTIDRAFRGLCCQNNPDFYDIQGPDYYETGDALISYAGQRIFPKEEFRNNPTTSEPVYTDGDIKVYEKILGVKHGAIPEGKVPKEDAFYVNEDGQTKAFHFEGYRHSIGSTRGDAKEACVENETVLEDTGAQHASLTEIKGWLGKYPSESKELIKITFNVQVVDATTNQGIEGAQVDMGYHSIMGGGLTDENGNLMVTLPFYAYSKYTSFVSANGYHSEEFIGSLTGATPSLSTSQFPRIELQPSVCATGDLGGKVIDAVSGLAVSDVSYILVRNGIERSGSTDSSGNYFISDLVRGYYELYLTKDGYRNATSTFYVKPNMTNVGNASIRQMLADGQMSIRLEWDANPTDLDSHLVKYDIDENQDYHIYFSHKSDSTTGDNLDRDDTNSYGPETTTIQNIDPLARYVFAVYHYSGSGSITATSNAHVSIEVGDEEQINTLPAPTSGSGRWWKVFEIINGEIIPCNNCMYDDQETAFSSSRISENKSSFTFKPRWLIDMSKGMPAK